MAVQHPRYPQQEVAQRGHQLYNSQIRDCYRRRQAVRVEAENNTYLIGISSVWDKHDSSANNIYQGLAR